MPIDYDDLYDDYEIEEAEDDNYRCDACNSVISSEEVRTYGDGTFCEYCYDRRYASCSECDRDFSIDDLVEDEGDYVCENCHNEVTDRDCPENPPVDEEKRSYIITLCRQSIRGPVLSRKFIAINQKDIHLQEIKQLVGRVCKGLYVYGLRSRPEFDIRCSEDIYEYVLPFARERGFKLITEAGKRRLGLSLRIRKSCKAFAIELINKLTYDMEYKLEEIKKETICVE
jgi:uncharacterized CHY-type Zn-finger protein